MFSIYNRRVMKATITALLVLVANPVFAADQWTLVRSKNFRLVGNASERQIRRVAENLEQFREAVGRLLPRALAKASTGTTVVVFRDDESYRPFKPIYKGKPANVAGYFQGGPDVNFITLTAEQETPRVIYHEYTHLLAQAGLSHTPAWFNEGIAEYYSTFSALDKDQKVRIGRPIAEHVLTLRDRSFLPLETLFTVGRDSPYYNEAEKQGIFYAESWALVHYLLLGDKAKRQPEVGPFLNMLSEGRPAVESFQAAFQTDLKTFQKDLQQYIQGQMAWPAVDYTFQNRLTYEKEMQARPLSEAEAQFHLGDLLLHSNRLEEAESYLKKATALDPRLSGAQASLGMLRMRQNQDREALEFLKRAAEGDSTNHLVHYYYAQLLQRQSAQTPEQTEQLEIMHSELKKAINLAPEFTAASELLAYVNLLRKRDSDESLTVLRAAQKLAPGKDSLLLMLAQVLMQTRQRDEATSILQRLAKSTSAESATRQQAQSLLEFLGAAGITREFAEATPPPETSAVKDAGPPRIEQRDRATPIERIDPVPPAVESNVAEGRLTLMECDKGVTLTVATDRGVVKLHSDTISDLQIVSYTTKVKGDVTCGPFPSPGLRVRITYRPDPSGATLGAPLVLSFVDEN